MARVRQLSPGFFTDERVVSVSMAARLLFQGLWCEADREGRLEDKPLVLKMRLFPVDTVDVKALLDELAAQGLICRYSVDGRDLLLVPRFKDHQHVHPKEAPSKLPPPPMHEAKARENESCMTEKPGKAPHGEGVSPSDVQAFGYSGPSASKIPVADAPAPVKKAKKPKPEKPTDPRHAPLVKVLCDGFEVMRGKAYPFKPRDAAAVKALLTASEPDTIAEAWGRALRHVGYPTVSSLPELLTHFAHFVGTGPPAPKAREFDPNQGIIRNVGPPRVSVSESLYDQDPFPWSRQ